MKNITSTIITIFLFAFLCRAQRFQLSIVASQDSFIWSEAFKVTENRSCVILATYFNSQSSGEIKIIKTSESGNILWHKLYGSNTDISAFCIEKTFEKGFIIAGSIQSNGYKFFLLKIDSVGGVIWSKLYDTGQSTDYCYSVQQTSDSGFIMAGPSSSSSGGSLVFKTDSNGTLLWSKKFSNSSLMGIQNAIITTNDELYLLSLTHESNGRNGFLLIKTDPNGDTLWSKFMLYYSIPFYHAFTVTSDGGILIAGPTTDSTSGWQFNSLLKLDSNGNFKWARQISSPGKYIFMTSINQTGDEGYFISGIVQDSLTLSQNTVALRLDSVGQVLWSKAYGNPNPADSIYKRTYANEFTDSSFLMIADLEAPSQIPDNICLISSDLTGSSDCDDYNLNCSSQNFIPVISHEQFTSIPSIASAYPAMIQEIPGGNIYTSICNFASITTASHNQTSILLSPTPAKGFITINGSGIQFQEVLIFNLFGELTLSAPLSIDNWQLPIDLDVSSLPPGIYFLRAETDHGTLTNKFIKE
jgi:hypothetical protein